MAQVKRRGRKGSMKQEHRLHKPKKGETFTIGYGPHSFTADVTRVGHDGEVHYRVRHEHQERSFHIGSPTHQLVKWWDEQ